MLIIVTSNICEMLLYWEYSLTRNKQGLVVEDASMQHLGLRSAQLNEGRESSEQL